MEFLKFRVLLGDPRRDGLKTTDAASAVRRIVEGTSCLSLANSLKERQGHTAV
jgi:hypothetical protein